MNQLLVCISLCEYKICFSTYYFKYNAHQKIVIFSYHVAKPLVARCSVRQSVRLSFEIHDRVASRVKHLSTTP